MSNLQTRLDAIERKTGKGQRVFISWGDARGITEDDAPRTQPDIEQAKRDGYDVLEIVVERVDARGNA